MAIKDNQERVIIRRKCTIQLILSGLKEEETEYTSYHIEDTIKALISLILSVIIYTYLFRVFVGILPQCKGLFHQLQGENACSSSSSIDQWYRYINEVVA